MATLWSRKRCRSAIGAAALTLFSFEDGTQGRAAGNWQTSAGTVAPSSDVASDGSHSLQINATGGGWFGLDFAAPVALSG